MEKKFRLGIAGVGIAAWQVLPHLAKLNDILELTAVADIRPDGMEAYERAVGRPLIKCASVEELCASPEVDGIWVATPNAWHAEHAICAAEHGKHVICEKPMAINLAQCEAIVEAVARNRVKYVQGHSKVYDSPIRMIPELIRRFSLGNVIHIHSMNWNDWLLRALTASEVDTEQGTGVVFRQGPHQIDSVRWIAGSRIESVRAVTGRHEPIYPRCEGNYTALLTFANGAAATLVFDGYGYFDVAELTWGIGESGRTMKNPESLIPRDRPSGPMSAEEKYALVQSGNPYGYGSGGGIDRSSPQRQPFFGLTIVSCERGVIRQSPEGIFVYGENGRETFPLPNSPGRAAELQELVLAVREDREPLLNAAWGMATVEVCLAILQSSQEQREVVLSKQTVISH